MLKPLASPAALKKIVLAHKPFSSFLGRANHHLRHLVVGILLLSSIILLSSKLARQQQAAAPFAPTLGIILEIVDGTAPFDADSTAGRDSANNNGITRTNDYVTYNMNYNVNGGAATNVTFTSTLPAGERWVTPLPAFCLTSGVTPVSGVSGQTVTCNIGNAASGTAGIVPLQAQVRGSNPHGTTLSATASVSANGATTQTSNSVSTTVSALPRYDLRKTSGTNVGRKKGSDGITDGVLYTYPINILALGTGVERGQEMLTGPITFTDDLSAVAPNAKLYTWDATIPKCGSLDNSVSLTNNPYGKIGIVGTATATNSVPDSGTFQCTQTGTSVDITITGADTSGSSFPTLRKTGGTIPADEKYFVSGYINIWIPLSDFPSGGGNLSTTNVYRNFDPTSISGQSNYGTGTESTTNNSVTINIANPNSAAGGFSKAYYNNPVTGTLLPTNTSTAAGDGLVVPDQIYGSRVTFTNSGGTQLNNLIMCDKFMPSQEVLTNNTTFFGSSVPALARRQNGSTVITPSNLTLEYGTGTYATTGAAGNTQCGDADSPAGWFTDPTLVPGGYAAISKVRVKTTTPLDAGHNVRLFLSLKALDGTVGTRLGNWAAYKIDELNSGAWKTGNGVNNTPYDPSTHTPAAGTHGDRVTLTKAVTRVSKTAGVSSVVAGNSVNFTISPTVTSSAGNVSVTSVTLTDILPSSFTYNAGSGSLTPQSVTVNGDGTTTVIWNLGTVTANQVITPVTYSATAKFDTPNNTNGVNTVVIASPQDGSSATQRTATATVVVNNTGAFVVGKAVSVPQVSPNGSFSYTLSYANISAQDFASTDLIDVIPFNGDTRSPTSNFQGTLRVTGVTVANGETVRYTKQTPASISQDPNDTTNQSGGATVWCTTLSGGTCPASLSEVTGVRIIGGLLARGSASRSVTVNVITAGNQVNDQYSNNFGGRAQGLALPVTSNTVTTNVPPAVAVGYKSVKVTNDYNSNGRANVGDVVTWSLFYVNTGLIDVANFQINDQLPPFLTLTGTPVVTTSGGATASVNSSYTGAAAGSVSNLLASGATLNAGGTITVSIATTVVSGGTATRSNQGTGSGTGLTANVLTDNVDSTNSNLPSSVVVPSGSLDQTQTGTIDPTRITIETPTLARMAQMNGYAFESGNLLRWQTSFEAENLGFRVYRQEGKELTRITPAFIAGSALRLGARTALNAGDAYSWWDATGTLEAVYWLEDVDLKGVSTWHGPVAVVRADKHSPLAQTPASRLLDELRPNAGADCGAACQQFVAEAPVLTKAARQSGQPVPSLATDFALAEQAAVKIEVTQTGWQRVSAAQLHAAGLDRHAPARALQLYSDGVQVPVLLRDSNGTENALDENGTLEFYGVALDNREEAARAYWLIVGANDGLRLGPPVRVAPRGGTDAENEPAATHKTDVGAPNAAPSVIEGETYAAPSFAYTVKRQEKLFYVAVLKNGEDAENFYGGVVTPTRSTQSLPVTQLDTGATAARVEVVLEGITDVLHRVRVEINGYELGEVVMDGQERKKARFNITTAALREGSNEIALTALDSAADISATISASITYPRFYRAANGTLTLTTGTRQQLTIDGFTGSRVRVWDITDAQRPFAVASRIVNTSGSYAVQVNSALANRTLLAVSDEQAITPARVIGRAASHLSDPHNAADFLIIAPRAFQDAAAPLAELRQSQGLRTQVIAIEDIYDTWAHGAHSVKALRAFLRYTQENWANAPRYVLLLGDASFDPRNYLGYGAHDYIPTGYIIIPDFETVADDSLADFDGNGIADISLGRLPARTPEQAATMISKIVHYQPSGLANGALFVSDVTDGADFGAVSATLGDELSSSANVTVTQLHRAGQSDAALHNQLLAAWNAGPSVISYTGHGSIEIWGGPGVLTSADAAALHNGERLPLVVTLTCLNGYFHDVYSESLAEALLKAANGGAVAVWASSGMSGTQGQQEASQTLYRLLYGGGNGDAMRLGDAVRAAKNATTDNTVRRTWILFGDPTLVLR